MLFFDTTPNLDKKYAIFLKDSYNLESETKSMNFGLCYIEIYWSVYFEWIYYNQAWFSNNMHWSSGKYWFN